MSLTADGRIKLLREIVTTQCKVETRRKCPGSKGHKDTLTLATTTLDYPKWCYTFNEKYWTTPEDHATQLFGLCYLTHVDSLAKIMVRARSSTHIAAFGIDVHRAEILFGSRRDRPGGRREKTPGIFIR